MPFTGNINSIVPRQSWSDLGKLLREMQAEINQLKTANTLAYATIDRGGITVTNGGSVTVQDTNGTVVAVIGALPTPYNRADGTRQPGIALYREDGSLAMLLGDANPTVAPYRQALQLTDRAGNVVVADDTNSGEGLALPFVPFGAPVSNSAPTDVTTSSTFVTLASAAGYWMNAKYTGQILVYSSDASTTGEVRIVDENGAAVGPAITISGAEFQWVNWGPVTLPGHFGDAKVLSWQARRTAGTGSIGLRAGEPVGVQS